MLKKCDYCDYDTSITLGKLEFPLKRMKVKNLIEGQFSESIVPVLLYEAQKWLREEKKIEVLVLSKGMIGAPYDVQVYTEDYVIQEGIEYNSYEEALLEGIKEAVEILKEE